MKKLVILAFISACFAFLSADVVAQHRERVRFGAGSHGTSVRGTVRGFAYRDYVVRASGGQTINLRLTASWPSTVLTVFLPNGDNLSGATEMDQFRGELPNSGDYVIRISMMRSAARRRGSVSNFTLKISIR